MESCREKSDDLEKFTWARQFKTVLPETSSTEGLPVTLVRDLPLPDSSLFCAETSHLRGPTGWEFRWILRHLLPFVWFVVRFWLSLSSRLWWRLPCH